MVQIKPAELGRTSCLASPLAFGLLATSLLAILTVSGGWGVGEGGCYLRMISDCCSYRRKTQYFFVRKVQVNHIFTESWNPGDGCHCALNFFSDLPQMYRMNNNSLQCLIPFSADLNTQLTAQSLTTFCALTFNFSR
jgi:hypothetical protein